ncbi:sulfuric ester hydrolase [Aureococcus anophagefferens]|nr:sulfuric ester hydrolase [Aureococcus anophagefferens]
MGRRWQAPAVATLSIFAAACLFRERQTLTITALSCSAPARAALLSGRFAHRVGFSSNDPLDREVFPYSNYSIPLGVELLPGHLRARGRGVPHLSVNVRTTIRRRLGYATRGVGKWNVGHCSERYLPAARGFDGFTGYFSPGLSYLDYTPDAERDFAPHSNAQFHAANWTAAFGGPRPTLEAVAARGLFAQRLAFAQALVTVDYNVERVFDALRASSSRDVVVAVVSDNGGYPCAAELAGSNHPLRGSKLQGFQGGVKVPARSSTRRPSTRGGPGGYKYMCGFDTFGFYNVTAYDQIQCWPGDASEAWLFDLRDDPRETANVDDDEARARLAAVAAAAVDDAYVPQHAFGTEEGNGAVFRHFQSAGGFVSPFGCAVNYLR